MVLISNMKTTSLTGLFFLGKKPLFFSSYRFFLICTQVYLLCLSYFTNKKKKKGEICNNQIIFSLFSKVTKSQLPLFIFASNITCFPVGYILGLGDRHVNNILIDLKSAELVHIDFGM